MKDASSRWFIFEALPLCVANAATDRNGVGIGAIDGPEADEVDFAYVQLWETAKHYRATCGELPDRIGGGNTELIVSTRLAEIIWNSRIPDRVGHIPCEIRGLEDEIEATPMADDYFFFYPGVGTDYAFDVIDREHAEYDTCEGVDGSQVVWKVRKWVVLRKSIPEFDLFYADYNRWLANEMFKELCELHGITGVSFSPVEVN